MNKVIYFFRATRSHMNRLVEFPLEEGGSLFVEVTVPESEGQIIKAGSLGDLPIKAAASFESSLDSIKPIASAIISKLSHIDNAPDEIGVEFGLSLKADANAILTKMGADANFKVNLSWKKEK